MDKLKKLLIEAKRIIQTAEDFQELHKRLVKASNFGGKDSFITVKNLIEKNKEKLILSLKILVALDEKINGLEKRINPLEKKAKSDAFTPGL